MAVSDRALDRLAPTLSGWLGVENPMETDLISPHPALADAGRFQEGTPPIVGAMQFAAAVEVIEIVGIEAVSSAIAGRVAALDDVLARAGAETLAPWANSAERAGILCFRMPGVEAAHTVERLEDAGLVVSLRGSWVRLAPHASTTPDVAGMLEDALGSSGVPATA